MIWLSVKRDFFIVEILLARSLLLKTLVLRGDYRRSDTLSSKKERLRGILKKSEALEGCGNSF